MIEKIYETNSGNIHYWINEIVSKSEYTLIFLPGLTADHRLFEKQLAYLEDKYRVFVWDAPGHAVSYPFQLDFDLFTEVKWLDEILEKEGIKNPVIIGQSMGGYLGQIYAELFPRKLKGLVMIDSPSLQRRYYTAIELWLLKVVGPIYQIYPWKSLLKVGSDGIW